MRLSILRDIAIDQLADQPDGAHDGRTCRVRHQTGQSLQRSALFTASGWPRGRRLHKRGPQAGAMMVMDGRLEAIWWRLQPPRSGRISTMRLLSRWQMIVSQRGPRFHAQYERQSPILRKSPWPCLCSCKAHCNLPATCDRPHYLAAKASVPDIAECLGDFVPPARMVAPLPADGCRGNDLLEEV